MNILYASNDGYTCFMGISLYSLLVNNSRSETIHIYILNNGISEENIARINQMVESFHRMVTFIDISDLEKRIGFDINACGYNITTFARLFIDDLLPQEVNKILYLDSDIVINGCIEELWNTDVSEVYMAAVVEVYMPQSKKNIIGLKKSDPYYNAGMLLINRQKWHTDNLKEQFLSYYKQMNGMLLYNDQDLINHCCKGQVKAVLPTYNYEPNVYYFPFSYMKHLNKFYFEGTKQEYQNMIGNPKIIHFLGDERPWVKGNRNPYRTLYYQYQQDSGWNDIAWITGKEKYMLFYHILNIVTRFIPPVRTVITNIVGINKYKWFGKQ